MVYDRSRWPELGILILGLVFSVGLVGLVWSWQDLQHATEIRQRVEICAQALHEGLVKPIEDVQVLAQFYGASDAVRGDEFARFTRPLLQRHPMLQALEWAPRVAGHERDAFEAAARAEGLRDFAIREQVAGHWRPAGVRPEYFPVWRIEPQTGNEPALGFDLASEPLRRAALQQACESGRPVASAPVTLVHETANQRGLIVFAPQYTPDREAESAADRCVRLRGVAVTILRLSDLVETALNPLPVQGLDFILLDSELAGEGGVLHVHPSRTRNADAVPNPTALVQDPRGYAVTITVAGRQWVLRGVPVDRNSTSEAIPILLFFLGLAITAALTALVWNRRNAVWRQRASEAELSRTSHTLKAALEAMADAVFISDEQGHFTLFNNAFASFHKFSSKHACAKTLAEYPVFLDVFLPDGTLVPLEQWAVPRALRGETVSEAEYGLYRRDTGERWVGSYNFAPIRDSKGQIIGSVVTARDITERKRLEADIREAQRALEQEQENLEERVATRTAELQRSEAKLRTIFDLLPVGISITDPQGHIVDCNHAAETILGLTRNEHLQRDYDGPEWHLIRPDGTPMPPEEYASVRALREGQTVRDVEMGVVRPEGIAWISVSAMLTDHPDYGVVIAFSDITASKHAQEAAEQAARAKSEFLAHMSHEIRTPMNAIIGLSELALHQSIAPTAREYFQQIHASAHLLLGILNDILDQSKLDSGRLTLEQIAFAPDELLERLRILFASNTASKGLTLSIEADPALPAALLGDPLRLQQILTNLLGNALKFTDRGGVRLRVHCPEHVGSWVRLLWSVEDTGIGMDAATLERLFVPFTQGDDSIARHFGGTGLGLSISRRLAELMGGSLTVVSTPGQGSTFTLDIGLRVAAAAMSETAPGSLPHLTGTHILVVEDQPLNQRIISDMLRLLGVWVTVANHGTEALEQLAARSFDAVLMDVQMPVMDGLTATQRIRENPAWTELPVIALTAGVTTDERQRMMDCGMSDLLPKPVTLDSVSEMLTRWLGGPARVEAALTADPRLPADRPSATGGESWTLPGFDPEQLAPIARDVTQWHALLRQFADSIRDDLAPIRDNLDAGERASAARHVHRLKGVAANVGATALCAAAIRLESDLQGDTDPAAALESLAQAHADALARIAALPAPAITEIGAAEGRPELACQLLRAIQSQLSQGLVIAPDDLLALRAALPARDQPLYQTLKQQLERFDHRAACRLLDQLSESLSATDTEIQP